MCPLSTKKLDMIPVRKYVVYGKCVLSSSGGIFPSIITLSCLFNFMVFPSKHGLSNQVFTLTNETPLRVSA